MGPKVTALRSLFGIGILTALILVSAAPATASRASAPSPSAHPLADAPRISYNHAGLQKEVFGFAPYWALSQQSTWNYNLMSTVSYFGLTLNWDATWITSDGGWQGFFSSDLLDMIARAHAAGDRVLLTIKAAGEAPLNDVVTVPAETNLAIAETIGAIGDRGFDGVNIDFEGYTSSTYPNIQAGMTNFVTLMSQQVKAKWPNAFVTVDTYTGSASWDSGLMRIDALAPVVDAMFIMAYDMSFDNMPGQAGPTAPLTGWTFNDTTSIAQYLTKAPASKIILGVPWYGYRFKTSSNGPYAKTSSAIANTYADALQDLGCGQQLVQHWDYPSQSPWASWYSPKTGDPCGNNLGSWEELYYENVQSLAYKYNLVNSSGIRGMGIWALGYEGGAPEIWSELNTYFSCPAAVTLPVSESTTEFSVDVSAGSCGVAYYEVQQFDNTQNHGWFALKNVVPTGPTASALAQGFPGYSYQFRVRAHSTGGVVSAWAVGTTSVAADATYSHAYKGLYTLDDYGGVHADVSPPVFTAAYWAGWKIVRAGKALPGSMPQSGAVLDGYGGLHYYGAPITFSGNPYWKGWDIARDFAFLPDGSGGYVLDGWGGLHPFAVNGHALPPMATGASYWPRWDIARKVVIFSDGTGGYVMDGYGGLHPFGIGHPAPAAASGGPYWPGWQIARDVVLVPGSHAGYVLDGFGGFHAFSGASKLTSPNYWKGWDIARALWLLPSSTLTAPAGYLLDGWGGLHPFGGAPTLSGYDYWPGSDVAHNLMGY